jgi:hypothetical protein
MTWAGRLDKIMATRKRHSPKQIVRKLRRRIIAGATSSAG